MEKVKQKGIPQKANRRFALVLVGFIVFYLISAWKPITLLQGPHDFFTDKYGYRGYIPLHYCIISLAWIPFAIKHYRQYSFNRLIRGLIIATLIAVSILLIWRLSPRIGCPRLNNPTFEQIGNTQLGYFKRCLWFSVGG